MLNFPWKCSKILHKSGQILIKILVALTINMINAATFISWYFLKDKKEFEFEQLKFLSESYQINVNLFKRFKGKS